MEFTFLKNFTVFITFENLPFFSGRVLVEQNTVPFTYFAVLATSALLCDVTPTTRKKDTSVSLSSAGPW